MRKYSFILYYVLIINTLWISPVFAQKNKTKTVEILQHTDTLNFVNLLVLNSSYREANLAITAKGDCLFFMSGRGGQSWSQLGYLSYKGKPEHDGDIWMSKKDTNGKWTAPKVFAEISTSTGEDEPNISPDGKFLYFQSWIKGWEKNGGPYYKLLRVGEQLRVQGLSDVISQFFFDRQKAYLASGNYGENDYATDGCAISSDGNTFIVAVGKYNGNMDLFMSVKQNNTWTYPKSLNISTPKNERSPVLSADGKTLYFASDGYSSLGGLDIFKATLQENGEFGNVVNIGSPFNTKKDDYGLIITQNGEEAYMVRGGDIYFINVKDKVKSIK